MKTALSGNNVDLSGYVTSEQLQQTAQALTNLLTVSLGDFYPKTEMDEKLSSIPTIRNEFEKDIFNDIMYSVEEYTLENLVPDEIKK